jgi:hypothetical protein
VRNSNTIAKSDGDTDRYTGAMQLVGRAEPAYGFD